ncbi:hypothetical protein K503DRAFT_81983 [Rhizopogon vinicolor AM-OR11-026]|uniref:Uncharacterized protein n=1 Tax=Rhizopogon vinicolor AM-OR11-026 TaxID=1314800 RepID=A0A1B7MFU7_9AGAM|nr:hypothetical protein K503DRAFT_81983 [Rhizopogon vinicolor AM-OR11-026]
MAIIKTKLSSPSESRRRGLQLHTVVPAVQQGATIDPNHLPSNYLCDFFWFSLCQLSGFSPRLGRLAPAQSALLYPIPQAYRGPTC